MSAPFWAEVHGATTHFPVVLTLVALTCESVAALRWSSPHSSAWRVAGAIVLGAAALSTVPAVASGLVLSRGELWGEGALRLHHRFVWPAFALIIALGVARGLMHRTITRSVHGCFVGGLILSVGLMTAAARYGGALLQTYP